MKKPKHGAHRTNSSLNRGKKLNCRQSKETRAILEINIKDGMPTVDVAMNRLEMALKPYGKKSKLIKIVHGYGSTGVGGKIRTAVRQRLSSKKAAGNIMGFIPGEEFSMFGSATQKALALYHKELTEDRDYNCSNEGITVVILK